MAQINAGNINSGLTHEIVGFRIEWPDEMPDEPREENGFALSPIFILTYQRPGGLCLEIGRFEYRSQAIEAAENLVGHEIPKTNWHGDDTRLL